jgi:hypothetical protein
MLAWTLTSGAATWEANGTHAAPVCAAVRPPPSTMPTCRPASPRSGPRTRASASPALAPARMAARPFAPWVTSVNDWVATAPTPGSTHRTPFPRLNQRDWTAAPSRPDSGSRATIEYVTAHLRVAAGRAGLALISGSRT